MRFEQASSTYTHFINYSEADLDRHWHAGASLAKQSDQTMFIGVQDTPKYASRKEPQDLVPNIQSQRTLTLAERAKVSGTLLPHDSAKEKIAEQRVVLLAAKFAGSAQAEEISARL